MTARLPDIDALAREVRIYVFQQAASTARIPQAPDIARALRRPEGDIRRALHTLAEGKVLILAPNDGDIWAANPFCAVPSGFRVAAAGKMYWGICIWDALGIAAAPRLRRHHHCPVWRLWGRNDSCSRDGHLTRSEGVVHFAIPAHHWWDNIGFT